MAAGPDGPAPSPPQGTSAEAQRAKPRAPFPIPSLDGKPLAPAEGKKSYRLPLSFRAVERFYRERFGRAKGVSLSLAGDEGSRVLTLVSKRPSDAWAKAVVSEGQVDTTILVTPVLQLSAEEIEGRGTPLVEFVFGRSPEAAKAAAEIDHLER
ncbi:MAG: hypothetical protein HYZ28_01945 [Myxococcales bacterium]|nr:hypothetical protein [Myxococcales bacterium]